MWAKKVWQRQQSSHIYTRRSRIGQPDWLMLPGKNLSSYKLSASSQQLHVNLKRKCTVEQRFVKKVKKIKTEFKNQKLTRKNSSNFVYVLARQCRTCFILTNYYSKTFNEVFLAFWLNSNNKVLGDLFDTKGHLDCQCASSLQQLSYDFFLSDF